MKYKYQNRYDAGDVLAQHLSKYKNSKNTIVLALPRGGVPVGYEVANQLNLPLDLFIVRKLGVPGQPEFAMGAIAYGGIRVINDNVIDSLQIRPDELEIVEQREKAELDRRMKKYRGTEKFPDLKDKTVILVDDGIATGASIRVAIQALREMKVDKIVVAVPVADQQVIDDLSSLTDDIICPLQPEHLRAVGMWYENFEQTEDDEVQMLMKKLTHSS